MSNITISNVSRLYQMESSTNPIAAQDHKDPDWYKHFEHYLIMSGSFEIPRPFMIIGTIENGYYVEDDTKTIPALAGGLLPYGERYDDEDMAWVYVLNRGHFWVNNKNIRTPTEKEYYKYFKDDVESLRFFIENKINKAIGEEFSKVQKRSKKNKKKC